MTVMPAKRMWSTNRAPLSTTDGRKRKVIVQDRWQVICDVDDTWRQVAYAEDLPRLADAYSPDLPQVRVKKKTPIQISPIFYHVDIVYEGEIGPEDVDGPTSPLDVPPEKTWTDTETDEPVDEDVDGLPIVTANNESIEGVTMKVADLVLKVKRNYLDFSPALTHEYRHSVSSDTFAGFPAGTARLVKFSAKEKWAEEVPGGGYWEVNASIQFRYPYRTTPKRAWWARVRHEGTLIRLDSGRIVKALDDEGREVNKPVLLTEEGLKELDAENAFWKEFELYKALPYNALGLL